VTPDQLTRSAEHANLCHQAELRRAVAAFTATPLGDVIGVQLVDLTCDGVAIEWVASDGAHRRQLRFQRPATSMQDLGEQLRRELHPGIC